MIEKSFDNKEYTSLSVMQAKGVGSNYYSFEDTSLFSQPIYYRLKMYNANGSFAYSNLLLVKPKNSNQSILQKIFPLPANEALNMELFTTTPIKVEISIITMSGKAILQKKINLQSGNTKSVIDVSQILPGEYIMKLTTEKETIVEKIIIQR